MSEEDYSAYVEDLDEPHVPSDDELKSLAELIELQVALEDWLRKAETTIKKRKAQLAEVSEALIPKAMHDMGVSKFTTDKGFEIDVREKVYASITKARESEAFDWLRSNGHGAIIKRNVVLEYGSGRDEDADRMVAYLMEHTEGASLKQKTAVHPSTLRSFVSNCMEEGISVPEDVFGVFVRNETKIKRP